jgi:hypothetical protein
MLHIIGVVDGGWKTMAEIQKPVIPADICFTKLAVAESQKSATDIRHGLYLITLHRIKQCKKLNIRKYTCASAFEKLATSSKQFSTANA